MLGADAAQPGAGWDAANSGRTKKSWATTTSSAAPVSTYRRPIPAAIATIHAGRYTMTETLLRKTRTKSSSQATMRRRATMPRGTTTIHPTTATQDGSLRLLRR